MKKTLTMVLALVLVFALGVGGTLAWLSDSTTEVKNTFTTSNIDIDLEESEDLDLEMVPGHTMTKDPKITVVGGSEACLLFVKIVESENYDDFMTYAVAEGWTELEAGVYYREVAAAEADQEFAVLKDDQVKVNSDVTKEMMDALTEETYPTLTFTAYAHQLVKDNTTNTNFTPDEAWANLNS